MHNHNNLQAIRDLVDRQVQTNVNVVYVTADPTFTGPIGGYVTGGPPPVAPPAATSSSTTSYHPQPVRQQRPHKSSTTIYSTSTHVNTRVGPPLAHSTQSGPVSSQSEPPKESNPFPSDRSHAHPYDITKHHNGQGPRGMSTGAKAGLAIGLLLLIALVAGVAFFFYRRKKNSNDGHQPLDDEKTNLNRSGTTTSRVSLGGSRSRAPRLSLRPVTEMFMPMSEKQGNVNASSFIASSAAAVKGKPNDNPFGDHAESRGAPITAPIPVVPKPLGVKNERTGSELADRSPPSNAQAFPVATGARPNSPPGNTANNVHRVQLDFHPSMEDELGLRAGQLVRMLHEYDDGWALCIRLDRSQQGVVPRTCLSKLPVKPRPQGPSSSKAASPQGDASASTAPADPQQNPVAGSTSRMRSQSNAHGNPTGPFGSGEYASDSRPRANSDAVSAPTQTKRKPVPGEAI